MGGGQWRELTLSHFSARVRGAMRSMILLTHLAIDMAVRLKSLRWGSVDYVHVISRLIFSDSVGAIQPEGHRGQSYAEPRDA